MSSGLPGSGGHGLGAWSPAAFAALKRPMSEVERQNQMQQALFFRSVKQKLHQSSSPVSPLDLSSASVAPSECVGGGGAAGMQTGGFAARARRGGPAEIFSVPPAATRQPPETVKKTAAEVRNQLQELERRLLDDDEEEVVGSAATWCSPAAMQQLVSPKQALFDTVSSISDGNLEAAAAGLALLKRFPASFEGGDWDQKLLSLMIPALHSRLNPADITRVPRSDIFSGEHLANTHLLHDASPAFKLALSAANLAILETCRDSSVIHVIDFDVGFGNQHAALIHSLAERCRRPSLRITAFSDPSFPTTATTEIQLAGERLARVAEKAGVALRFGHVTAPSTELDRAVVEWESGEDLVFNFPFFLSRVPDESVSPANPRDELLRRVRAMGPTLVAVAEQDVNTNTAPFAARFSEACAHYAAVHESLEPSTAAMSAYLARRAANAVASEGAERVDRCEVFGKWRARFGMAGLRPVPVGPAISGAVRSQLASAWVNPLGSVREEAGGLCFGWAGRSLAVISAWR